MAGYRTDINDLLGGIDKFQKKTLLGCRMYAETAAKLLQNEMKSPKGVRMRRKDEHYTRDKYAIMGAAGKRLKWRDRTTEARKRVSATVEEKENGWMITLKHGVWYGIYLETAFSKVYAVISPAVEKMGSEIMEGWAKLLEGIFGG